MARKEIFDDLNLVLRLNQHIEEITASDDAAATLLTKETSFKVLAELASIANPDPREDAQFEHQRSVFLASDQSRLPFHLQGDQAFNDASALAKRRQLRHSEAIKGRISFLWNVARGHKGVEHARTRSSDRQHQGSGAVLAPGTTIVVATIREQEYAAMMVLVFKVLRDDFVLETAQTQIRCDWEVDSHHGESLTFEQFFAAIFELVDVWTCDILESTYVRFLELLARRITLRVVVFLDDMKLKLALSDNFDDAVVVKAIPLSTIKKFASVAKIMEGRGVKTVGELASADPTMVETQRVAYLQRNTFSRVKIGADLQNLLNMFREISSQFQDATYTLNDMVLQRRLGGAIGRERGADTDASARTSGGPCTVATDVLRGKGSSVASSGWNSSTPLPPRRLRSLEDNEASDDMKSWKHEGSTIPESQHVTVLDTRRDPHHSTRRVSEPCEGSEKILTGHVYPSRESEDHDDVTTKCLRTSDRWVLDGDDVSTTTSSTDFSTKQPNRPISILLQTSLSPFKSQSLETTSPVLRRGIKRINTFHDLSVTETGVIDALKTTFLMEKGISIQRKSSVGEIRAELIKFGVDSCGMTDEESSDKYASLYDMFVLRDGENIRTLAESLLARIKVELAAHGIVVNDDEVEAMYDGFYGSIVTGSGETIVEDAKSWVDETLANKSLHSYIKQDYHELKSIDEVKSLGSEVDDDEFVSLLSLDDGGDVVENDRISGTKQSSPNNVSLSRRPSLYLGGDNPKRDVAAAIEPDKGSMKIPKAIDVATDSLSSLKRAVTNPRRSTGREHLETRREIALENSPCVLITGSNELTEKEYVGDGISHPECGATDTEQASEDEWVDLTHFERDPHSVTAREQSSSFALPASAENPYQVDETTRTQGATTGGDSEPRDRTEGEVFCVDDGIERRSTALTMKTPHAIVDMSLDELSQSLNEMHLEFIHQEREQQGVGYEYETVDNVVVELAEIAQQTQTNDEPKVPEIVVGGLDSAQNVSIAARYIQLLGLGHVAVVRPENDLVRVLSSSGRDAPDLVRWNELDIAIDRTDELFRLVGRRVILFGGDALDDDRTRDVAAQCIAHGAIYFAILPLEFPLLRAAILEFFEASAHLYILRQRRPTAVASAAVKLVPSSIRVTMVLPVQEVSRRAIASPPYADSAKSSKRKSTAALPHILTDIKERTHSFRPLRAIGEMPGGDVLSSTFTPVMPSSPRAHTKSPRLSSTLKKFMR